MFIQFDQFLRKITNDQLFFLQISNGDLFDILPVEIQMYQHKHTFHILN